ncbi:hypothetical protein HK100_012493 [Physocladia obscura]|uniref:Uncharacterized protein n=1 Tax=Physocladia obscura TaxID=109957 RepID=A0AAD5T5Q2_9FUNG|nr:hypothetical protein HK100_012493 [Physocladia obscura]
MQKTRNRKEKKLGEALKDPDLDPAEFFALQQPYSTAASEKVVEIQAEAMKSCEDIVAVGDAAVIAVVGGNDGSGFEDVDCVYQISRHLLAIATEQRPENTAARDLREKKPRFAPLAPSAADY